MEPAMTAREEALGNAIREAVGREEAQKSFLMGMQATTIMQGMYVKKARMQVQAQEEKARDKRRAGKLHGGGTPKLLSEKRFVNKVIAQDEEKAAKAAEKAGRQARRQEHSESIRDWKKTEKLRKERNQDRRERFRLLVASWTEAKEQAKAENRKFSVPKPKCQGMEAPIPRPKPRQIELESDDGEEDGQDSGIDTDDEED